MISALIMRNFQSHKKSELQFHPNVNAIIGKSDSGKTALLRGIYWVVYNRPSGQAIISEWNRDKKNNPIKETSVQIIQNEIGVVRVRSPELNGYRIVTNDNEEKLEAIGMDVPDKILNIINLSEVNIQKQMDAPFLLSESASEVARFFNKEIKLDLIDKLLSNAESKRRGFNADIKNLEAKLSEVNKELEQYNILEEATELCEKLKIIEEQYDKLEKELDTIRDLEESYSSFNNIIKTYEKVDFDGISKIISELDTIKREEKITQEQVQEIEELHDSFCKSSDTIEKSDSAIKSFEKLMPKVCPLCGNSMENCDE